MVLLLNIVQLAEIVRAPQATGDLTQAEGAVRAQTMCTDMTARGQSPVAPWPIFLRTAEDSAPSLTNPTNQVIGRSVRALSSPAG